MASRIGRDQRLRPTTSRLTGRPPSRWSRPTPTSCLRAGQPGLLRRAVQYLAGEAGIRQFLDIAWLRL